jgi:hypothetical protein
LLYVSDQLAEFSGHEHQNATPILARSTAGGSEADREHDDVDLSSSTRSKHSALEADYIQFGDPESDLISP